MKRTLTKPELATFIAAAIAIVLATPVIAGSAEWSAVPADGNWSNTANCSDNKLMTT